MIIALAIALLIGFFLVHGVKLMRLYLIMLDEDIPFGRFVPAYFRTTFINLVIPYKLGEIYRVIVFWRESKSFKTGFFAVLVDRFFDTLALVLILLPYQLVISKSVTLPVILLSAFILCVVFFYLVFPSTYKFINRYIIMRRNSRRSLAALGGLEVIAGWYEYVKKLVTGRYGMLILFSFVAWVVEMFVLAGFCKLFGYEFTVADFGTYIESIVSGGQYMIKDVYTCISAIVVFAVALITLIVYLVRKNQVFNPSFGDLSHKG